MLDIVAEKTGYPKDMLDLDLDLEADLGVDTVKQAEMFAAIRAAYDIPRDENLKLRDFPTLAHVIRFARDRAAAAVPAPAVAEPVRPAQRPEPASFEAADRVPRRVPVPCWRPALDFFKPTGGEAGSRQPRGADAGPRRSSRRASAATAGHGSGGASDRHRPGCGRAGAS